MKKDKRINEDMNMGYCKDCIYAKKYAGDYISCDQIKTTFPKDHFCAYFERNMHNEEESVEDDMVFNPYGGRSWFRVISIIK